MKATDVDLARLALSRGWISVECHDLSLAEADRYQALGLDKSVVDVLVEQGSLTADQVRALRDELGLSIKRPRIGDYEIVRRIGLGGMGSVFEARHVRLKQRIALKLLQPRHARDPVLSARFLKEARMLARLNHPHLVHAIDAGKDGEYYYLAMEYVEGENLLQILAREGPLKPLRALEVVRDVCTALTALEEKGLVHRDVKPSNMLVGLDGVVKLADFGLLKAVDEVEGPKERSVCGTPHYISPEQVLRKEDIDIRSDLYSLGASWYHLLAGRPPFVAKTTREILDAHVKVPPPRLRRRRRDIPHAMEETVLRWLSKDRDLRPQSSWNALEDLRKLASGWGRAGASPALRPFRRRSLLAAVALLALVFVAGIIWFSRARDGAPSLTSSKGREEKELPTGEPATKEPAMQVSKTRTEETPVRPPVVAPEERTAKPEPAAPAPVPPLPPSPAPPKAASDVKDPADAVASFLGKLGDALSSQVARQETRAASWAESIAAPVARFEPLRRLAASFHAGFVAVEPERDPPGRIYLRYDFDSPSELEDFRFIPGTWVIKDGALQGVAEPEGKNLDSVAWFASPFEVEGEMSLPGSLIVGFGSLRVAPGVGGEGPGIWFETPEKEAPVLAAPAVPSGEFTVSFRRGAVEISLSGNVRKLEAAVPETGRLLLRIAPGASLSRLSVDGSLEPTWASRRLRLLGGR